MTPMSGNSVSCEFWHLSFPFVVVFEKIVFKPMQGCFGVVR
jgi:hypothetical protein